jgi:hypothetical protein
VFFIRLGGKTAIFEGWGKIKGVSIGRILTLGGKKTLPKITLFGSVGGGLSSETLAERSILLLSVQTAGNLRQACQGF